MSLIFHATSTNIFLSSYTTLPHGDTNLTLAFQQLYINIRFKAIEYCDSSVGKAPMNITSLNIRV
jgi:hypothetical protein